MAPNLSGNQSFKVYQDDKALDKFLDQVQDRFDDFEETKIQGNLIKWWEKEKLGDALYGDVIWAVSVDDGSIFAIKRLNMFKSNKVYNQECIDALKNEVEILK